MGRVANPLTGTQQNDEAFAEFSREIRKIGGKKLASYGLVSHERVYHYLRRVPVAEKTEDFIRQSVKLYKDEKAKADNASLAATNEILHKYDTSLTIN